MQILMGDRLCARIQWKVPDGKMVASGPGVVTLNSEVAPSKLALIKPLKATSQVNTASHHDRYVISVHRGVKSA
jgi:hypothetical protein